MKFVCVFLLMMVCIVVVHSTTIYNNAYPSSSLDTLSNGLSSYSSENFKRRCPLCDSSVYSYCGDKLFHDSCCCHNPNNPYDRLPYQCRFADCSFLHANTCAEHKLITACCCTNLVHFNRK